MSLGVPVVATTPRPIPEFVGEAAVLGPPRDVPALSEALLLVSRDATTRERLVTTGLRRVTRFTWDDAGRQLAQLYRTLADVRF